jgi:hypothetical protein
MTIRALPVVLALATIALAARGETGITSVPDFVPRQEWSIKSASPTTAKVEQHLRTYRLPEQPTLIMAKQSMSRIDPSRYPLFNRMASALFPGIWRDFSSEDQLPAFLLSFFLETEIDSLVAELEQVSSMNLNDEEWEQYWYSSPAASVPRDAKSSTQMIQMVMAEIRARRAGK